MTEPVGPLRQGLSPRVRGNLGVVMVGWPMKGSIPASAGEPHRHGKRTPSDGVYPRECGGTQSSGSSITTTLGLSPRVRGNRESHMLLIGWPRSIPASAGEPVSDLGGKCGLRVYPRECGGTVPKSTMPDSSCGLSPRVRGNRAPITATKHISRSIPASAGEPSEHPGIPNPTKVYPRECGGTQKLCPIAQPFCGLSPRVRGNLGYRQPHIVGGRSIPASAGEPYGGPMQNQAIAVYPRECGGTLRGKGGYTNAYGLSPRVRGNPG